MPVRFRFHSDKKSICDEWSGGGSKARPRGFFVPLEKWIDTGGVCGALRRVALRLRNQSDLAGQYGSRQSRVWVGGR